jgi:U3 small nucleolar RNA-associated protein 19
MGKCRALESSLWELEALERHYHPAVARLARLFQTDAFQKMELDLEPFIQLSYQSVIHL